MKFNIKHISKFSLALLLLGGTLTSCTKNFEEYNKNNIGLTDEDLKGDGQDLVLFLRNAQMSIYNFSGAGDPNSYQVQQNLNADVFSGFFMSPTPFNSGQNNLNYAMVNGWNGEPFQVLYLNVIKSIEKLKSNGLAETYPALWGSALVIKVEAASRVTDIYGPIPYSKVGTSNTVPYDKQSDVYAAFFKELDEAVTALKSYKADSPMAAKIDQIDLVFPNTDNQVRFKNWLKIANSLRLRLAMRLVKIDATLAKTQAEKALDPANGGVLESNSENFKITVPADGTYSNPLWFISKNWADTRINATLSSYMTGLNDPRISKYMAPVIKDATTTAFAGKYIGIRAGADGIEKDKYQKLSALNTEGTTPTFVATTAPVLMTAAEVYFLRAEAALRGWNNAGGTAQSLYEKGVETSFTQWGVTSGLSTYLNDNTSKAAAYEDPFNAKNNAASPSTLTIKWNEGATNEEKLERIITQKWLAIFPEGQEAWSEFRRTGYPRLFPVVVNNSGGLIDTKIQIRRLPFPQNEYNTNAAEVQSAISLLGGPDNGGTRLWWDVNKGNF
ncbi:SusD/RagB family nutrient-binding outer membrane lipoprotein [Sphingobacterium paramultivorum]|uniref:SusD/RagB family nutrient-binding outer membrane lipoprotein n=1 Tax=Sphingobacterium paramultivorum TaxID=2886510 RepID=A0A7G5E856_9SPHI|nr:MULTISPECIES: RagB/SusD family nutrient uptake outer membrane protein [Sphingobacterium]QMV70181.1 SusD/RagB family nutrient-binding outer membrane lipoprotein [Sphingobacterium paramultivorum]WSO14020.1 RagB/SusD family nutrient uptake outer membrane protein [Sphingobacterium paramultivorum]